MFPLREILLRALSVRGSRLLGRVFSVALVVVIITAAAALSDLIHDQAEEKPAILYILQLFDRHLSNHYLPFYSFALYPDPKFAVDHADFDVRRIACERLYDAGRNGS